MRDTNPAMLTRRARRIQNTTAQQENEEEVQNGADQQGSPLPDVSQNQTRRGSAAIRRDKPKRIKWINKLNREIIKVFFYVSKCQDIPPPGWRSQLHYEFNALHPELMLTEQNVVDRKNVILRKGYLTPTEIEHIRRQVGEQLTVREEEREIQDNERDEDIQNNTRQEIHESNKIDGRREESQFTQQTRNQNKVAEETEEKYLSNLHLYETIEPNKRPKLPKIIFKPKTKRIIKLVNETLYKHIKDTSSILTVHTAIYVAAATVLECNGQTIRPDIDPQSYQPKKKVEPGWKIRLMKEIDKYRAEADLIRIYLRGDRSSKINKKIKDIFRKTGIDETSPNVKQKLKEQQDLLRQKAKAKGARMKRYNEATKQREQNKLFNQNQRQFYINMNSEKKPTDSEININKQQFTEYWNSIWNERKNGDLEAPWMQQIEQNTLNIPEMEYPEITTDEIKAVLKKAKNWKAPGPDGIQNFWIKSFEAAYEPLAKSFRKILEEPDQIPSFLAVGKTYLLYKKGNPEDPATTGQLPVCL